MKKALFALCLSFTASQLMAALPNQSPFVPASGDYGAFSVQDQGLGAADPDRAIAFDNFSLTGDYNLSGICWTGIYAEPLPLALSDTDFIVEIWGDAAGAPDLGSGPVLSWTFEAGPVAGTGGPDLSVTANGSVSPSTGTVVGGGPGFDYSGSIGGTLLAGDYWISILADQTFANAAPVVDPEWMWHLGTGTDGFYAADLTNDGAGTPAYGIFQSDKNLAFELKGSVVPEPSTALLAIFAVMGIGAIRRKR